MYICRDLGHTHAQTPTGVRAEIAKSLLVLAKRFFLNTAALTGAKLLVTLSQVLILPIIAKYLSVEDFGAVALAMTVVMPLGRLRPLKRRA